MAEANFDTRAKIEAVQARLREELTKPKGEQNIDFIRRSTAVIRAFSQSGVQQPEGAADAFQGEAVQARRGPEVQGMPTNISPQEQLATRQAIMAAKHRGQDIVNFLKRPFLDDAEQRTLAEETRVQRAQEQLQLEADAQASGVDPKSLKPAEVTGGLLPDVAAGAVGGIGLPRTIGGAIARIGTEAGIGAVLGGSTVPLDEDPTNAALLDGGITFGLGTMTEIPGLAGDFLKREIRAARNSNQDDNLQRISAESGIDLTIGERTQVPAALIAERNVPARPGGPRAEFLAKRKEQLRDAFNRFEQTLNPDAMPTTEIIAETRKGYDNTISAMSTLASQQFRNNIEEVLPKVGARMDSEGRIHGGFKFIQPTELISELQTQRRLLADQPLSDANRFALQDLDREIRMLQKGGLDLGQVQRLLSDLSGRNAPSGIVIKDNTKAGDILSSGAVQRALNRDLDAIVNGGSQPEEFVEAITTLQTARKEFAGDRAEIDVFKNTAIDKLLGKVGDPTSADFAQKVLALDTAGFNTMMEIADEANPRLGNAIRSVVFKEVLDKHTKLGVVGSTAARSAQDIDVKGIINELGRMPMSKFMAFTGTHLDATDAQHMRNTLVTLRAIADGSVADSISSRTLRERMEQYAINAASRDVGFISRLLAGEMSPGVFERLLFTKQGQDALSTMSRPKVTGPQFAQAFTYINTAMTEDEKAVEELKRQRVMKSLNDPNRMRGL